MEKCKYCNNEGYKTNGDGDVICQPRAFTGKCGAEYRQAPVKRQPEKQGRNEPCKCGSGKKYKNCCIN